jgi:hypothetical protein
MSYCELDTAAMVMAWELGSPKLSSSRQNRNASPSSGFFNRKFGIDLKQEISGAFQLFLVGVGILVRMEVYDAVADFSDSAKMISDTFDQVAGNLVLGQLTDDDLTGEKRNILAEFEVIR